MTPDLAPIQYDNTNFEMSPFFGATSLSKNQTIFDLLLSEQEFQLDKVKKTEKTKKGIKNRERSNTFYLLHSQETQLDKIIEEAGKEDCEEYQDSSSNQSSYIQNQTSKEYHQEPSKIVCEQEVKDIEFQKQSTNFSTFSQVCLPVLWDNIGQHFKEELINNIKAIVNSPVAEMSYKQKGEKIRQNLSKYLFDYQMNAIEETWSEIEGSTNTILFEIVRLVQNLLNKKIGLLTFQNRRVKLIKYLQKKKRRIWKKKVSYDCRKKVADDRLRIKGKFVTKRQVCSQLGLQKVQCLNSFELKALLSQIDSKKMYRSAS